MAGSTYSSNLKIELMSTGENSGTWGSITNTNLGTALEQAVVGYGNPDFLSDANLTITITNSNAAQAARALVLNVTSGFGSLTATRELVVPTSQKQYIVQNNTTGGQSITVKTSGGTGITVPNGRKAHLYVDGTNVIQMFDFVDINGGAIDGTAIGAASASTGAFTSLAASGTTTLSGLTASTALALDASKNVVSVTNTGTGDNVLATSPTLVTPNLGTPSSGTVTNLTGTASININGTVGATTATTGAFTDVTTSGTVTLNGGTANGVAFLNGSKVLTTGSALTFDGTNLGIGVASPLTKLHLQDNGPVYIQLTDSGDGASRVGQNGTALTFGVDASNGTTEQMRLTSTGLGIGTSSPSGKLHVVGPGSSDNAATNPTLFVQAAGNTLNAIKFNGASTTDLYFGRPASVDAFAWGTVVGGERMRLDSSGNLGLGVTPSAWDSLSRAFQVNARAAIENYSGVTCNLAYNVYRGTGNQFRYVGSDTASMFSQSTNGGFQWFNAPSGTADNAITFTQAMTLDASGKLNLGTTASSATFTIRPSSDAPNTVQLVGDGNIVYGSLGFDSHTGAGGNFRVASNNAMTFLTNGSERARIDSSGNLLVGTTSTLNGNKLFVTGTTLVAGINVTNGTGEAYRFYSNGTAVGTISVTGSATAYNTSSDYRLKNITGPITNSGAYIDSLNPVEGTWKSDGSAFVGLIAHEVQEASRTLVATGVKDGEQMQGMDYSSAEIIANMLAELQSLRARVAALESN